MKADKVELGDDICMDTTKSGRRKSKKSKSSKKKDKPEKVDEDSGVDESISKARSLQAKSFKIGGKKSLLREDDIMSDEGLDQYDNNNANPDSVLEIEYGKEDGEVDAESTWLPLTQAPTYMQQDSEDDEDETPAKECEKMERQKVKSVVLNTRDDMQAESKKDTSDADAREGVNDTSDGIPGLQMSTRGIHNIDPAALAAAVQTQRTQQSSTISPFVDGQSKNNHGNEESDTDERIQYDENEKQNENQNEQYNERDRAILLNEFSLLQKEMDTAKKDMAKVSKRIDTVFKLLEQKH